MVNLTFSNLKGGTGKTTSVVAIGAQMAQDGRSVLALDLDPQGNLALNLGHTGAAREATSMIEDGKLEVWDTEYEGLDLIPSDRSLGRMADRDPSFIADRLVALQDAVGGEYDYFLVDTPPNEGSFVRAALTTSDGVIVPVAPGRNALEGLLDVERFIDHVDGAPIWGAFACRVDTRTVHDVEIHEWLEENRPEALGTFVRETVKVREAENEGVPITVYAPDSTAAEDYRSIARTVCQQHEAQCPRR